LLGAAEVASRYSIHPKSVANFVKAGKIPRPVVLSSAKRPKWRESDINRHILSLGWQKPLAEESRA
jgi:predicted DNA-binding transcriptional regulator AlpA